MKRQSVLLLAVVFLIPLLSQAVERTSVAGAAVRLDDSILRKAIESAKYVIEDHLPSVIIIIVILLIIILIVELLLRLFR